MNGILKILTKTTPQKYSKQYDGFNSTVLFLTNETLLTFNRVCWQKYELWLHKKYAYPSFYMYLFFQIDIFTLNSRKKASRTLI